MFSIYVWRLRVAQDGIESLGLAGLLCIGTLPSSQPGMSGELIQLLHGAFRFPDLCLERNLGLCRGLLLTSTNPKTSSLQSHVLFAFVCHLVFFFYWQVSLIFFPSSTNQPSPHQELIPALVELQHCLNWRRLEGVVATPGKKAAGSLSSFSKFRYFS